MSNVGELGRSFCRVRSRHWAKRLTSKENRHLEWKQHPPLGPSVGNGPKYRMVKAAVSFANWEGGFVVFGVDRNGEWRGLTEAELEVVDPANLGELINGCIFPEIPVLNYIDFHHKRKLFALLHVPPSPLAPHVTTKEIVEKDSAGKLRPVLARHASTVVRERNPILPRHSNITRSCRQELNAFGTSYSVGSRRLQCLSRCRPCLETLSRAEPR